jgi:predicted helicase
MSIFPLKPTSSYVKAYYAALAEFHEYGHTTEGNIRSAFADLLKKCSSPYDWRLIESFPFRGTGKQRLIADGALEDDLTLVHGLWEAKDNDDDLDAEIKLKVAAGYPLTNILFQSPDRAVLYQSGRIALDCDLTNPESLIEVLQLFFDYRQPHEVDWKEAVIKFSDKIPELAGGVTKILEAEQKKNSDFREKFQAFADLCRQSVNPDLTDSAIQKMLVQHLLTERIFRKVFDNQEFLNRNIIAIEIEKVIHSITAKHFSRDTFLKPLDRFYKAIEEAALTQTGYTEKQNFLNAVYEKFFQSFDRKQSDTHGIVYTPQPIVDFMVRSVEEVLKLEFNKSLSDEGVHILDPFTGTGNFITRIIQQIKKSRLPQKYASELHCNEIMLLPYYIASMNIEHAYMERVEAYKPFEGICLVDTFELAEGRQSSLFTPENTQRVQKQKDAPIKVIIANPPYRVGQKKEDEENKKRKYPALDHRVSETYVAASNASSKSKLTDSYIRALRWATDRIEAEGVIAFVTNSGFLDRSDSDGIRKYLSEEFDEIYVVDLGGSVRKHPHLSGTTHNVFGIRLGVCISILVRRDKKQKKASINYLVLETDLKKGQRLQCLTELESIGKASFVPLIPDARHNWLNEGTRSDYESFIPIGDKAGKKAKAEAQSIFRTFSLGVNSNRDPWVFNFSSSDLLRNVRRSLVFYNSMVATLDPSLRKLGQLDEDGVLPAPQTEISWSEGLKLKLLSRTKAKFREESLRTALFRPFTKTNIYFDAHLNERRYLIPQFVPDRSAESENRLIIVKTGREIPMFPLATNLIPSGLTQGGSQHFPFYVYDKSGMNRRENITDWALDRYRRHYKSESISKWDIFHSTYALLHHPEYRSRYAADVKRGLPRIPFPKDLQPFAAAGKLLMELHVNYEQQAEYPLEEIEHPGKPWTLRVEKMSLNKSKTELRYNGALTLHGIPPATFDYRLGNRSALEWVVDQYAVSTDSRSGIVNDPNRAEDERYILRLIGQVITVSLETQQIVTGLPSLDFPS